MRPLGGLQDLVQLLIKQGAPSLLGVVALFVVTAGGLHTQLYHRRLAVVKAGTALAAYFFLSRSCSPVKRSAIAPPNMLRMKPGG